MLSRAGISTVDLTPVTAAVTKLSRLALVQGVSSSSGASAIPGTPPGVAEARCFFMLARLVANVAST